MSIINKIKKIKYNRLTDDEKYLYQIFDSLTVNIDISSELIYYKYDNNIICIYNSKSKEFAYNYKLKLPLINNISFHERLNFNYRKEKINKLIDETIKLYFDLDINSITMFINPKSKHI